MVSLSGAQPRDPGASMISPRWLETRKPHWSRLENLLTLAGRGASTELTHRELRELALLYRQIAADLAAAREDPTGRRLSSYLNQLLGKAHNLIYSTRASHPEGILLFYRETFPRIFREAIPYVATAFLIFMAAGASGWIIAARDPAFHRFILGGAMVDTIERREMWTHPVLAIKPLASSAIMTNNIAVCLTAAASGITAGLGTVFLMLNNGLLIGVIGAACFRAEMSVDLWSFIAPHGALEIPSIFISGGAGLLLARGLLFPGSLPRRASLAQAGVRAIKLTLGTLPLLVVAGLIEGFISPAGLPAAAKFLTGFAGLALLSVYLACAGREPAAS